MINVNYTRAFLLIDVKNVCCEKNLLNSAGMVEYCVIDCKNDSPNQKLPCESAAKAFTSVEFQSSVGVLQRLLH